MYDSVHIICIRVYICSSVTVTTVASTDTHTTSPVHHCIASSCCTKGIQFCETNLEQFPSEQERTDIACAHQRAVASLFDWAEMVVTKPRYIVISNQEVLEKGWKDVVVWDKPVIRIGKKKRYGGSTQYGHVPNGTAVIVEDETEDFYCFRHSFSDAPGPLGWVRRHHCTDLGKLNEHEVESRVHEVMKQHQAAAVTAAAAATAGSAAAGSAAAAQPAESDDARGGIWAENNGDDDDWGTWRGNTSQMKKPRIDQSDGPKPKALTYN